MTIVEAGRGEFDLAFDVTGQETTVTIELCFRPGGQLSGVEAANGDDNFHLVDGEGAYVVGQDVIRFGPGNGRGAVRMDAGEKYSYLGGNLVPAGLRVYISGRVPLTCTLRVR